MGTRLNVPIRDLIRSPSVKLPTPSRAWINRILDFANLADASELRDPSLTPDDKRALLGFISRSYSLDNEWIATAPDYAFNWSEAEADKSQKSLRETLGQLSRYKRRTRSVDRQLRGAIQRIRTDGLAGQSKQSFSLATLDEWWGLGLLALLDYLEELGPEHCDRIRKCKFKKKCSNFFIDWPGRRGGQPRLYCSKAHSKAAESQRARDKAWG